MSLDKIHSIISKLKASLDEPRFFQQVFTLIAKERKNKHKEPLAKVCCEEYDSLSRRLDRARIQDSCAVRNVLRTRKLATLLIDDKGEIHLSLISQVIENLKAHLYSWGPDRQHDSRRQEHILKVLTYLKENPQARKILKNISCPLHSSLADQIIRETLQLPSQESLTDAHVRRAVLSAWLCYLRQNVGSCFATAPAIIVHDEQPLQFLNDMNEIFSSGSLKRVVRGVQYTVPLSISWGAGDLKKNFFLYDQEQKQLTEISYSPGLLLALEATGVINKEELLLQKQKQIEESIKQTHPIKESASIITTMQHLLQKILLDHLDLTEKDLQLYEKAGSELPSSFIHLLSSSVSQSMSKIATVKRFYQLFKQAKTAFKSLADNALLKSWEFTLASFAETKAEFTRWNLYSSLGIGSEDKGGIGFCISEILKQKLSEINQKIRDLQQEYEVLYSQLKYLETRRQTVSSEKEADWLKNDYKTKRYEFDVVDELRQKENNKGQRLAQLHQTLADSYDELFPQYFQEVYDADMQGLIVGPYDDSPAGFRLLYKYGRANTSQWTYIHQAEEFIAALNHFFIGTESELASRLEFEGLQNELTEIITAIVTHIKTTEFIETAFYRIAATHHSPLIKDPLDNLDRIDKKPWSYTSGGTMGGLVSCYFRLDQKPTEVGRWVENPTELLVFILDVLKQIPHPIIKNFSKEKRESLLIHSPTHAFLLKPYYTTFFKGWQREEFTYTWVRDQWIKPMEKAIEMITLDESMMHYLIDQLQLLVPINYRYYFRNTFERMFGNLTPIEFRNHLIETMQRDRGLQIRQQTVLPADEIDSLLFNQLPLFPIYQMENRLEQLFKAISSLNANLREELLRIYSLLPTRPGGVAYGHAKMLQEVAKALLCLVKMETSGVEDFHQIVAEAARYCGYALPKGIAFADTNWMKEDFSFVVNPGSGQLELWRVEATGTAGAPMSIWKEWVDGSRQDRTWGIYTRPFEYSTI